MAIGAESGLFVYASDKKAPNLSDTNPQYVETRKQIASYNGRFGASAFISEMVEQELKKSEPKAH